MEHIATFLSTNQVENEPIFLDCEGLDLGCLGGELGLIQLGVENIVYLVDVIAYPESLVSLKPILEDPLLKKVVWDGRSDYSELWNGHGIKLTSPVDLQLVRVYEKCRGVAGADGYIMLEGMGKVFSSKAGIARESGINQTRFAQGLPPPACLPRAANLLVQETIKQKHLRNDTDFWISRPLGTEERDYAAFDILQLRALYKHYRLRLLGLPNIPAESTRYLEIWKDGRKDRNAWYVHHGILPQEILHAQWTLGRSMAETRECGGCGRKLHQCSFRGRSKLCFTCTRARSWRRY